MKISPMYYTGRFVPDNPGIDGIAGGFMGTFLLLLSTTNSKSITYQPVEEC